LPPESKWQAQRLPYNKFNRVIVRRSAGSAVIDRRYNIFSSPFVCFVGDLSA